MVGTVGGYPQISMVNQTFDSRHDVNLRFSSLNRMCSRGKRETVYEGEETVGSKLKGKKKSGLLLTLTLFYIPSFLLFLLSVLSN